MKALLEIHLSEYDSTKSDFRSFWKDSPSIKPHFWRCFTQMPKWPKLFTKIRRFCEDRKKSEWYILNCLPVQLNFVDLMTASNNSLHKVMIYMSLSYTHPIFNQVHLATASVWKPTETGGFCISKLWDFIKSNIKHHKTRLQTHHYLHSIQIIWEQQQKNSNFRTCSKDRILSGARKVFRWGRHFDEVIKGQPTFDTPEVEPQLPSSRHSWPSRSCGERNIWLARNYTLFKIDSSESS